MSGEADDKGAKNRLVFSTELGDLRRKQEEKPSAASVTTGPVRVCLDTKARRGKVVTLIRDIPHCPAAIEDLARKLKTLCGAGGSVEGHDILIQGDHRDKIKSKLTELGYHVKKH